MKIKITNQSFFKRKFINVQIAVLCGLVLLLYISPPFYHTDPISDPVKRRRD